MDYQQITCSLTGKNIKADRMYKIRNDDCIENIVSICYNCPFADSENPACINCYGTIAQNAIRQINEDTRRVKMETVEYRNNYCKVGDDYVEMMEQFKQQQQEKRLALEKEKLEAEVLKQQKELEEMNAKYQDVEEFDPEFTKDEQGRDLESYEDEDFVEKNENNPEKAETLKAKEESEENVDAAVTDEVEEEKPVKKKAKLQIKATDYVSKYEELADAKKKDTTSTVKKKRKVKEEDQEALEIKEKLEALKKQQYEIKPEYTEEELDEFNNPEEEHWYDDDEDVDYDQYDEFYDN